MTGTISRCILPYCDLERYDSHQRCILHLHDAAKDLGQFNHTLNRLIDSKGYIFHGISFPGDFTFPSAPTSRIRFLRCRFAGSVEVEKLVFPDQVSIENTVFEGPVVFSECHFEKDVFFINNRFENIFSLFSSGFHENIYLGFNTFRQGVNLYRVGFKADNRFLFRHCEMGCSFFHNTDITNMEFVLCRWHKFYRLAEEQYHLKIPVKFGELGVPDTYLNRIALRMQQRFPYIDLLTRVLYRSEYLRQKSLTEQNKEVYVAYGGWNDNLMAEDTYRKLRLKYSEQGEPEIAGQFFFREKIVQRRQKKAFQRIWDYFTKEVLFGYGERPLYVLGNSGILILLFTLLYAGSNLLYHGQDRVFDILTSLYFSVVTFTTLGYGDYHPEAWLRFFAACEALLGAVFIALFIVTMTRKFIR